MIKNTPYTIEELTELLRNKAEQLGRPPTRDEITNDPNLPSHTTFTKYFGSWNKALENAGVGITKYAGVTRDMMIEDIDRVTRLLGKTPTVTEYRKHGKYTRFNRHGGWIGLVGKKADMPQRVTKEKFIQSMKMVVDDLGYVPSTKVFQEHKFGHSLLTLYKNFDSYDDLVVAAGFEVPQRKGGWNRLTNEQMISELLKITGILGYIPSQLEFTELSLTTYGSVARRFGGYGKFIEAAGLRSTRNFTANDGHVLHSRFELHVDNFLFEIGLPHKIQVLVTPTRKWTCDFVVGDTWIECNGLSRSRPPKAETKFLEKLKFYRDNSYDIIVIQPSDDWKSILTRIKYPRLPKE